MTNTTIETELLRLIVEENERVLALSPYRGLHDEPTEWAARWTAIRDLKSRLGIRINSDWIGQDPKSRQARRRGLLALEVAGLVALSSATGNQVTHVMLIDTDDAVTASPLSRPE